MENTLLKSFKRFFESKGSVAPIAEKANRNFALKKKNIVNLQQRLHYFAVGHVFKNIDTENIFNVTLDEGSKEKKPTKFKALQLSNFTFYDNLKEILDNIRNINSHFIHDFKHIKLDNIDSKILDFLRQSFELAVLQTHLNEKEISFEDFNKTENKEKQIVNFLLEKFYPLNDKRKDLNEEEKKRLNEYKAIRNEFSNKPLEDAINTILFVNVDKTIEWKLFVTHKVFDITSGKYLSFEACLFLLTMFLYKGEANQLISKIKRFKRNDDNKFRSKRNLFSFYSKKFSSQDIDSEENHLVKFRDLIQYLNHYPTIWNKDLELESGNPIMTDKLKEKIIEMEINRCFPDLIEDNNFKQFAIHYLFNKEEILEKENKKLYLDIINKNDEVRKIYYFIKNDKINFKEFKKNTFKKYALEYVVKEYFSDNKKCFDYKKKRFYKKERDYNVELNSNKKIKKLKIRIAKNLLFVSYGRNKDRFMDFATRFLAETNYFGKDAEFKMYQFHFLDEKNNELIKKREEYENMEKDSDEQKQAKKQYDKLKFHQGKLIHFSTFENHLKNYESWDTPFVIENNAIQIKVTFSNGIKKIVSIQRNLMIYFFEDALYNVAENQIEGTGKCLLDNYYTHHQDEFNESKLVLLQNTTISKEDKTAFKKILPKRLLHHYAPAMQNNLPEFTTFQLLLEKAKKSEKRYEKLKIKAEKEGNKDDFIKRNKGKSFKLQFIRKVCNLMYFKDIYLQQIQGIGHRKRFHITKDEFNDFSKWMYAFDETLKYKDYLRELFSQKGFFDNADFKSLFESSSSLDIMYQKTKLIYERWLKTFQPEQKTADKYTLNNYEKFFNNDLFYINVSHFIGYLESKNKLKRNKQGNLIYNSLQNEKHLIAEYYYKENLDPSEYKSCGKLYNKLKSVKLEDALLYELAMFYLKISKSVVQKAKTNVIQLLTQDVVFNIKYVNKKNMYDLIIPFNKIDSYVELLKHKEEQEKEYKGTSFLGNLLSYIEKVKYNKDIKPIYDKYIKIKKLSLDDINKINNHIISNSVKFTKVALALEEYFIFKDEILIKKDNRITFDEIKKWKNYFAKNDYTRNKAFHFGLPNESYEVILKRIENKFIQEEVKQVKPTKYADLDKQLKSVCNALLDTIHNDYFNHTEKDKKKKRKDAEKKYFYEVIEKQLNLQTKN